MKLKGGVGNEGVGGEEGWSTFVRPYLRPDDRCRGPSLDKLSFVLGLLPRCHSVYYSLRLCPSVSIPSSSLLVSPRLSAPLRVSVSLSRARASARSGLVSSGLQTLVQPAVAEPRIAQTPGARPRRTVRNRAARYHQLS